MGKRGFRKKWFRRVAMVHENKNCGLWEVMVDEENGASLGFSFWRDE